MTSITILVPAWGEPGLNIYRGSRRGDVQFSPAYGCEVFLIKERLTTLPQPLTDLPIREVQLIKHNSPVTKAIDGRYFDPRNKITALVETYVLENGVRYQSISVTAPVLSKANIWFDHLMRGEKSDFNLAPISYEES